MEVKSVRVRKRNINTGSLDIKVVLSEEINKSGANDIILIGFNNDRVVWQKTTYSKSGLYKDFTNNMFIDNFILVNSKIENNSNTYDIIQDPWKDKSPTWRSYGYDPYYLNNGSQILISWTNGGGKKYSDDSGNEINNDTTNEKTVNIIGINEFPMQIGKSNEIEYKKDNKEIKVYSGTVDDISIVDEIIEKWKMKVFNYDLNMCSPNNEACSLIEYKSPIQVNAETFKGETIPTNETKKETITVILPENIKVRVDTTFKIFIGKNKEVNTNIVQDDEITDLSEEYTETDFEGMDEAEIKLQNDVSSGQEDSDSELVAPGTPAKITQFSDLDSLLKMAGDCARELGKNPRVNYQNLRIGYVKGVHGLCPQGTLSVLYALTGIKQIGQIRGNANTFSMNGGNSFVNTGYFNSKINATRDYFISSSMWQIGDVIAVDYTGGKPYGHIQVWTGFKWVSDFTQNRLQITNIDWSSAALHRMNNRGIDAVTKQSSSSIS